MDLATNLSDLAVILILLAIVTVLSTFLDVSRSNIT